MTFDLSNLNEVKKYSKVLNKRVEYVRNEYVKHIWTNLYRITPRLSGAAASSWNISINNPDFSFDINKTSNNYTNIQCKLSDSVYISTGCPYMRRLNYGWSKKAPMNFIELCIAQGKSKLNEFTLNAQRINY